MQTPREFKFEGDSIPDYMCDAIERYLNAHVSPGSFLYAVLCNDLKGACQHADHNNIKRLHVYVAYFYNCAPMNAWGSPEKVEKWLSNA